MKITDIQAAALLRGHTADLPPHLRVLGDGLVTTRRDLRARSVAPKPALLSLFEEGLPLGADSSSRAQVIRRAASSVAGLSLGAKLLLGAGAATAAAGLASQQGLLPSPIERVFDPEPPANEPGPLTPTEPPQPAPTTGDVTPTEPDADKSSSPSEDTAPTVSYTHLTLPTKRIV